MGCGELKRMRAEENLEGRRKRIWAPGSEISSSMAAYAHGCRESCDERAREGPSRRQGSSEGIQPEAHDDRISNYGFLRDFGIGYVKTYFFGRIAIATAERVGFTDIGSGRVNVTTFNSISIPITTINKLMATEIMTLIPKEIAGTTW